VAHALGITVDQLIGDAFKGSGQKQAKGRKPKDKEER
jgi:hypothetical protein